MLITDYRTTQALIDLSALSHNYQKVKQLAPKSKIMAVIKSDAYGHGLLKLAQHIEEEVDAFAVACIDEAIYLRQHHIQVPIIILEGFNHSQELHEVIKHDLTVVLHHHYQLEILKQHPCNSVINVWIKLDTGMHRLGFQANEITDIENFLKNTATKINCLGFMSHFACADTPDSVSNQQQMKVFQQMTQRLSNHSNSYSFANSAAIIQLNDSHFNWVRPGVMLYGVNPFFTLGESSSLSTEKALALKPVMTLQAKIIAIKQLKKGDSVGYGFSWQCQQDSIIGIISIGYGDGYPRHAKNGTPVLIHGQKVPLVGRVSMDMICVDLTTLIQPHKVNVGDNVVLWGKGLPIETIAICSETIAYELLCGISNRVHYHYINN